MGLGSLRDRVARLDALALTAAIWFLAKFLRYLFPPLFPTLTVEYGVSNAVVGGAFTALMLAYAAMQLPSGVLADRFGGWRVVAAGAALAAVASLALAAPLVTGSRLPFAVLVAAMVLVGVGTGMHKTVAVPLLSRIYSRRRGRALGVLDTFGAFGGVVAPVAVVAATTGALADALDWPAVFLAAGATGFVLAGAFVLRVPERVGAVGDGDPDSATSLSAYVGSFADRDVAAFVAVTVLFSFTYNGAVAFLPTYLVEAGELSTGTAGAVYAALFAVSVVQVGTGAASDRVGRLPVIGGTLALAAAALVVVVAVPTAGVLVVGASVVAFGLGSHGFRPVRGAYLVELVPDDVAGGALGVVRTAIMGVGAIAPATVGVLAEAFGFRVAFAALLAALVGALVALAAVAVLSE
ncbi:MFS transporter [Halorubellus sp. PRR65]|uniref:MFS transporter n=1 Tax=Halorubellus sp. PRR65 TaxID=3098148 RepID=UPI002B259444|nr:MFS transporter [Halorubellus sp. PRR65]